MFLVPEGFFFLSRERRQQKAEKDPSPVFFWWFCLYVNVLVLCFEIVGYNSERNLDEKVAGGQNHGIQLGRSKLTCNHWLRANEFSIALCRSAWYCCSES